MSDAEVRWHRRDGMPAVAGEEHFFSFRCPRHGQRCDGLVLREDLGSAQWGWDGNAAAPTFAPTIDCVHCGWHGYIVNGRCKSADGNDEPEPA